MSEATERKAREYLLAGYVTAVSVGHDMALFTVQGSAATPYTTRYDGSMWRCDCPAQMPTCAHIIACSMVTDFPIEGRPTLARERDAEIDELLKGGSVALEGLDPYAEL